MIQKPFQGLYTPASGVREFDLWWPGDQHANNHEGPAYNLDSVNINVAGRYAGFVFIAHDGMEDVASMEVLFGAISAAANGELIGVIETVDAATGNPTGTAVATSPVLAPIANVFNSITFNTPATLTSGTAYFAGVKVQTQPSSGNWEIKTSFQNMLNDNRRAIPYPFTQSNTKLDATPDFALRGADADGDAFGIYIPGVLGANTFTDDSWASNSNPDRRGVRFRLACRKRLKGFSLVNVAASNFTWQLYDSDGITLLQSRTEDKDIRSTSVIEWSYFPLTSRVWLNANQYYRLVILPGDTTARNWLTYANIDDFTVLEAWPAGRDFHWTQVNGAPTAEADWTNEFDAGTLFFKRPVGFQLHFDAVDFS